MQIVDDNAVRNEDSKLQAIEAEVSVLGALLIDHDALPRVLPIVEHWMFTLPAHRLVFAAALRVHARRHKLDPVSIGEELKQLEQLQEAGGLPYLAELLDAVPTAANVEYHAQIVRERAERRQLIAFAHTLAEQASDGTRDVSLIAAAAREQLARASGASARGLQFLNDEDMEQLPAPAWAVAGMYPLGGFVVVFGPSGVGKSFLLLDWALAHATGLSWLGRHVQRGPVVYVAAEGSAGLGSRIRAWKHSRNAHGVAGVHFLTQPVPLMQPRSVDELLLGIESLGVKPVAVIFDTLARNMVGGDENSAADMGLFIAGADRIRQETGAAVLVVHHTGRNGEHERGSTALSAAADAVISLKAKDDQLELACTKMKDGPAFNPITLELRTEGDSCVVITPLSKVESEQDYLTRVEELALRSLHSDFLAESGATVTEWQKAEALRELSNGGFYKVRTSLCNKGFVEVSRPGRGARYTVTDKGAAAITPLHSTVTPLGKKWSESNHSTPQRPPYIKGASGALDQNRDLEEIYSAEAAKHGLA